MRRSNKVLKMIEELERKLLLDQEQGLVAPCHHPKLFQVEGGAIPKCEIKPFTERRCPTCDKYQRMMASTKSAHGKRMRTKMAKDLHTKAEKQFQDEKEALLSTNAALSKEVQELKMAYTTIGQEKATLQQAFNQVQAGNQHHQITIHQLNLRVQSLQNNVSTLTFYLGQQTQANNIASQHLEQLRSQQPQYQQQQQQPQQP